MDLQTILTGLAVRCAGQADQLTRVLTELDPTSDALDVALLWPAAALLQEAAGVAATLAATGPVEAPESPGAREAVSEAYRRSQGVSTTVSVPLDVRPAQLAEALGHETRVGDEWMFDQLLAEVREARQVGERMACALLDPDEDEWTFDGLCVRVNEQREQLVRAHDVLDSFTRRTAEAAGAPAAGAWITGAEVDQIVERVRVQREERSSMLTALRDHLGRAETATDVSDLVEMLGESAQNSLWIADRFRMDLRVALGDLPRETTDEALVAIARRTREERDRMRKAESTAHGLTHNAQIRVRRELVDVAKALGTYAPGMDDMPDDELRTTVHTIARQVLADHEMQSRNAEEWRRTVADIAEHVRLGRGAQRPEILRAIDEAWHRAYGLDSWPNWADEMAEVLGVEHEDGDYAWTDEALELLVDRVRELRAQADEVGVPADASEQLAHALGYEGPTPVADWAHLLDQVRDREQRARDRVDRVAGNHRHDLARALNGQPGVDFTGVPWPGLIGHVRALADRENGRPSAPPISTPAVSPLSARRVAAGPSVDEYRAGQENSTNMASWTDEAGAHLGEPERERRMDDPPGDGWTGVNRGEPA